MLEAAINRGDVAGVRLLLQEEHNYSARDKYIEPTIENITGADNYNIGLLSTNHCYEYYLILTKLEFLPELRSIIMHFYIARDITPYLQILRLLTRPSTLNPDIEDVWETTSIQYQDSDSPRSIRANPDWIAPFFKCTFAPSAIRKIIIIGFDLADRKEGLSEVEVNFICTSAWFYKNKSWMLFAARQYEFASALTNLPIPEDIQEECQKTIAAKEQPIIYEDAVTYHNNDFSTLLKSLLSALSNLNSPILFATAAGIAFTAILSTTFAGTLTFRLGCAITENNNYLAH